MSQRKFPPTCGSRAGSVSGDKVWRLHLWVDDEHLEKLAARVVVVKHPVVAVWVGRARVCAGLEGAARGCGAGGEGRCGAL